MQPRKEARKPNFVMVERAKRRIAKGDQYMNDHVINITIELLAKEMRKGKKKP